MNSIFLFIYVFLKYNSRTGTGGGLGINYTQIYNLSLSHLKQKLYYPIV